MTLLQGPGPDFTSERRRTARRLSRWSAGFGLLEDPYLANVTAVSHRAARRRLRHCLELHRDRLARTPTSRAAYDTAAEALAGTAEGASYTWRVAADGRELLFWLLPAGEADRLGCRPKR